MRQNKKLDPPAQNQRVEANILVWKYAFFFKINDSFQQLIQFQYTPIKSTSLPQFLQQQFYSRMHNELANQVKHSLTCLPSHPSFSQWVTQHTPLLLHLPKHHNQMILSHQLYSLVHYENQISVKYFALVDYLLRSFPSYSKALESVVESVFVKTYAWLHQNRRMGDCQLMRKLRAGWSGKLHPQALYNMKVALMSWIHVDIDIDLKYNGERPNIKPKTENITPIDTFEKRRTNDPRRNSLAPEKRRFIDGKREADSTEESNNVVETKTESTLRKLKQMAPHKCKLCGKRFSSLPTLRLHQEKQMKQNIKAYKQRKIEKESKSFHLITRQQCLPVQRWDSCCYNCSSGCTCLSVCEEECYFFLRDFKYETAECFFCCGEFEMVEKKEVEDWAYKNCCKVVIDGKNCAMHKTCFDLLQERNGKQMIDV